MVSNNLLAIRYSKAIFSSAKKAQALEEVKEDFDKLEDHLDFKDKAVRFLISSTVPKDIKKKLWEQVFTKLSLSALTRNLINVLVRHNRLKAINNIIADFKKHYYSYKGVSMVEVKSAFMLSAELKDSLQEILAKALNSKVHIVNIIDTNLIGGLSIKVGSQMLDLSVYSQLGRIKHSLQKQNFLIYGT